MPFYEAFYEGNAIDCGVGRLGRPARNREDLETLFGINSYRLVQLL